MSYFCPRCKKIVVRLIPITDAETTAVLSSEERIPLPRYDYYCPECAKEILQIENNSQQSLNYPEITELINEIELQKGLMISVSTGGPRIQEMNQEYQDRRRRLKLFLKKRGLPDPNPYDDLWAWYGKWSSGDLPTYQSRRIYISGIYKPLIESLSLTNLEQRYEPIQEPTGWNRVDRGIDGIRIRLETATNEEEYQMVGLLCRETLISLAQAVYNPEFHKPLDNVAPSSTDASRMLEAYFSKELEGQSNENERKHAKASLSLANELQHRRTACFRDAAICAEATRTVVNIVAIISGRKEP
jgi:DNA-directed RNA polymerase subunit RPC12/RpoP